jgi:hypothetical protein
MAQRFLILNDGTNTNNKVILTSYTIVVIFAKRTIVVLLRRFNYSRISIRHGTLMVLVSGIVVRESPSGNSFSEERKPVRRSATFISWHRYK